MSVSQIGVSIAHWSRCLSIIGSRARAIFVSISVGVPTGSIAGSMSTVTLRPRPKVTMQGMMMLPVAWASRTGPAGSLISLSKNGTLIDGVGVGSSTKRTTMPLASSTLRSWLAIRSGD